jgi:TrmH family RNA methyltransferase
MARGMWNFGLRDLWIVRPKAQIGLEAQMRAAHARHVLESARVVSKIREATQGCEAVAGTTSVTSRSTKNVLRMAITPKRFAETASSSNGQLAIMFGRESSGLNNEELEACDFLISIPSSPEYRALNVAHAGAIIFYELFTAATSGSSESSSTLASNPAKNQLLRYFNQITKEARVPTYRRDLSVRAFRSMVVRAMPSRREATLLMGVLRRTLQMMRSKPGTKRG